MLSPFVSYRHMYQIPQMFAKQKEGKPPGSLLMITKSIESGYSHIRSGGGVMAPKKASEPPAIIPKEFTSEEEINRGIEKLKRRIAEVQDLDPQKVRYNDEIVHSIQHRIRETVRDVFGNQSPEFRKYGSIIIREGDYEFAEDEPSHQRKFARGIPRVITTIKELIKWLEEKRSDLGLDPSARARTAFEGMNFHPRIGDVCRDLYRDGHYAQAIFDASKALINFVKERSGRHDLDGASLIRTVFSKNNPILAFNDLSDIADQDEQEGMMHLFEGAVLAIRNPGGHSFPEYTPEQALEHIGLLSLLANHLQQAKRPK